MNQYRAFFSSTELLEILFSKFDDWKDILALSLVNKQLNHVANNKKIDLTFIIHSSQTDFTNSLPSKTARAIEIESSVLTNDTLILELLHMFVHCYCLDININYYQPVSYIEKICKISCSKNVLLQVRNSPQHAIFKDLIKKYTLNLRDNRLPSITTSDYCVPVKRKMDNVLIEVPKDRVKSQLYFMEQSLHLARENLHHEPLPVGPIGSLNMTVFQQLLNNNNRILKDIEIFVLVTGFNLFAHNQFLTDDRAYAIRPSDISSVPAAKVKHKQNTDKSFTELPIFVELYEFLIVSSYILHNNSISPFLGSSFAKFHFGNTVARNTHVLEAEVPITKAARSLNQYFKRCSNKPWGYRCYSSQKHRHMNTHHFASYILALITSVNVIKEADVESLWYLAERLPTYETIAKTISPKSITFDQLMGVTNNEGGQYFRLLLDVATRMEKHVPSYTLGVYSLSEAKEAALQIMKSGLKEEIKKQQLLIVSKRKAEF